MLTFAALGCDTNSNPAAPVDQTVVDNNPTTAPVEKAIKVRFLVERSFPSIGGVDLYRLETTEGHPVALTDEFGDPYACEEDLDCIEFAEPDLCIYGAVCNPLGLCDAAIYDSCLNGDGKEKYFEAVSCGSDYDCESDDNVCTREVCNFNLFGGTCVHPAADLPDITCGLGVCENAIPACVNFVENADTCAEGDPTGTDEDCNGLDENCDGTNDDGYVETATDCGVGECFSTGTMACVDGDTFDTCTEGAPMDETCDDLDNDCDGLINDDFDDVEGGACSSCYEPNYGPALECGMTYVGNESGFEDSLNGYVLRSYYEETGYERIYPFTSSGGVRVFVKAVNVDPETDIDYFLLMEECSVDANTAWGNTRLVFVPEAGISYLVAIDEYEGGDTLLEYDVEVECMELDCGDGIDNDGDDDVDCDDDDCAAADDCILPL